ncbi:SDR family oxidoreductase [Ralstonia solanacearum]|uniref:SDR family oxidoreductase n=1 Tax=Ralstonia solanacearum TaxID=305 RepID=UPI0005C62D62|nr:SDR family oxidoreductase [Ralstonia solanacearum]MBB6592250.1 SDR family oxidoreductase [Ralstonia solanacearum]MBB6596475.1 SDR family oxidoreductase [Ralstonia solanacearum]MDB0542338.1 SDR family oxidoreductase [Ralstonia solanacearum]MDB0552542.1 SDR family oxidoreductase [Ralstonia solanacearum]MDB0557332.1 SDR family oxidoreductase [Ralstonia solanacearum]
MSQIIFITGASSGIGQALARQYAARGATLGLVARRVEALHDFVQTLPAGITVHCYAADVRDAQSMRDAAAAFVAAVGVPDVVIANAGISVGTDLREAGDLPAFAAVMETNWMGVLHTLQPFVGPMLARAEPGRPGGTLVGVASVAGVRGLPGAAAYSASKAAVIKLMESLRVEFSPKGRPGLRVVTLAPGYIRTPMTEHNPYPMPFLMPADRFAQQAVHAIDRGTRFKVLPWQMGVVASLLHVLPRWLYDFAFARAPRKPRNPGIA